MTAITDIWTKITSAVTRALTFNVQKIDAIIAQIQQDVAVIETDIEYVGNYVVSVGPTLISDAEALVAALALFPSIPSSISSAITAGVTVLQTIITAIEQVTGQGSAAQSLVSFGSTDSEVAVNGYGTHAALSAAVAAGRVALSQAKKAG